MHLKYTMNEKFKIYNVEWETKFQITKYIKITLKDNIFH